MGKGDDIGARVRAVPGLAEVVVGLLGDGLGFGCVEDNDRAMEWALRAYRAGQAATPDGPRRWALPDEPGPEVTAVRGGSQTIYRRAGPHWQDGTRRGVESWWEILADGPLTDVTPAADGQDDRDG